MYRPIKGDFNEYHMEYFWKFLNQKFGFNTKEWEARYFRYHLEQRDGGRQMRHLDTFYRFGIKFIQPILNQILCRRELHPTFHNLCNYIAKKYA